MKYDFKKIGERIRAERFKNGYRTQDDLCEKLHIGRNKLSSWEQGKRLDLNIEDLLKLCELFHCEIGYLLGEYDTPQRTTTDISIETQLSPKAVENILFCKSPKPLIGSPTNRLDNLLSNDDFMALFQDVQNYYKLKSIKTTDSTTLEAKQFAIYRKFLNILSED